MTSINQKKLEMLNKLELLQAEEAAKKELLELSKK
jgi:hypothetical protein